MKNVTLIIVAIFISQTGCSMCCGPFDYDYGAFGGSHLRSDRSHGRVGSILSDPASTLAGPSADSNLSAPPEPNVNSNDDEDFSDDDILDQDDSNSPKLEPIEPDTLTNPKENAADDSTASTRWRPRPLR